MENCVGCFIKPFIKFSCFCAGPPINVICVHKNGKPIKTKFLISHKYLLAVVIILIYFIINACFIFIEVISLQHLTHREILNFILLFMYAFSPIIICTVNLSNSKEKMSEFKEIVKIVENYKYYGLSCFISSKMIKNSKKVVYAIIVFVVATITNVGIFTYKDFRDLDLLYFLNILIFRCLICYIENIAVINYVLTSVFYYIFYRKYCAQIKFLLSRKCVSKPEKSEFLTFEIYSRRLRRLYLALNVTYKQLNLTGSLTFLIWFTIIVIFTVFSSYQFIIFFYTWEKFDILFIVNAYTNILGIVMFLEFSQRVTNVSEDVLSFLFKYPISKLSTAEAAQVEMLITTLRIQKPVLRASDIFTVGTRLLASISGTVVTYVLVALQFHASWAKH